jgi:hypothetical protein
MAWRGPGFGLTHAGRLAGSAALSLGTGTAEADYGLANLIDDATSTFFRSTAAGTLEVDIDQGAQFATSTGSNRLVVPIGHNLTEDVTLTVYDSTGAAFSVGADTRTLATATATAGDDFAITLTATERRFLRVKLTESSFSGTYYELPQLIITEILRATVAQPSGRWSDNQAQNSVTTVLEDGGTAQANHSALYQTWAFEFDYVAEAAEIADLDLVVAASEATPLVLEPPYDTDSPRMATLTRREREIFRPAPGTQAAAYRFDLSEYSG